MSQKTELFTNSAIRALLFKCLDEYNVLASRSEFASGQWTLHNDAETISESTASHFNNLNIIKEGETET